MNSKYDFYDIVKIHSSKFYLSEINGKQGVIRGMAQSEEKPNIYSYAVDILDDNGDVIEGWSIFEEDLIPMHKKADQDKFKTGDSVRITYDSETGEGNIID